MKRPFLSLALLALACSITGCSSGNIGTVTGTVHLDGEPLEGAMVTFYPQVEGSDAFENAGTSQGITDANGYYELILSRDAKGAMVGEHLVYIETGVEGGGGGYGGGDYEKSSKERVPKRYNSESELKVTVKAGSNTIDFKDLTSEGDKNEVRDLDSGRY